MQNAQAIEETGMIPSFVYTIASHDHVWDLKLQVSLSPVSRNKCTTLSLTFPCARPRPLVPTFHPTHELQVEQEQKNLLFPSSCVIHTVFDGVLTPKHLVLTFLCAGPHILVLLSPAPIAPILNAPATSFGLRQAVQEREQTCDVRRLR
jgi:hypothetical protein